MTTRDRTVLVVVVLAAAIIGAWFAVIEPKRSEAGQLGSQVSAAQAQLATAQAQVAAGQAAKRSYGGYYSALAKLGEAVPTDDDVPSLIYQIQHAANVTGTAFSNFDLSASSSSSAPATGTTGGTGVLPPGVTLGSAGLPVESFNLTFYGNYFHLAGYLGALQRLVNDDSRQIYVHGRLMTLNAISLVPASTFPDIQVSLNLTTYLSPATTGVPGSTSSSVSPTGTPVSTTGATGTAGSSFPTAAVTGGGA